MALNNIRLGDYIERSTANNHDLKYGNKLIEGVTSKGVFDKPKGDPMGVDLKPYKLVFDGAFVYNPTRLNLGSLAYRTEGMCIVSHLYMIFYLTDEGKKVIDPKYLYMYFRRDEFYREVTFRNFGSQRPEFNFNDMSDIEVPLPDISIQRKYVSVYEAMLANQQSYESGLEDLKIVFEGYMDDLRYQLPHESIGKYIAPSRDKNENLKYGLDAVRGVSIEKKLIDTKADMTGVSLKPYYLLRPEEFAYVTVTSRNGGNISIAINDTDKTYICSSSYIVFRCKSKGELFPQYLMLYFSRSEFNRYARYMSCGSARETFDWSEMNEVKIPIPSIDVQKAIADIYTCYIERMKISELLKSKLKFMCPILIKGSVEEAQKGA